MKEPRQAPKEQPPREDIQVQEGPEPQPESKKSQNKPDRSARKTSWTISELYDADFPEPKWAIPEIIPEGLTVFGGRPKVGKSWIMLQTALSIGSGGVFLNRQVERGNVLYLALEDSERRLLKRLKIMGANRDMLVRFETEWRSLKKGGLDDLIVQLEAVDYRLVIIDTLTRALPGVDQKKDPFVGQVFNDLQRMGQNRNIAIAVVDHTRKPAGFAADPVDDILHTTEKTAIADAIFALYKTQGKPGATLLGRGRDIEDVELEIYQDHVTKCWQPSGAETTQMDDEILDALEVLGKSKVVEISRMIGENKGNVYKRLIKLCEAELVIREKIDRNVYYELDRSK